LKKRLPDISIGHRVRLTSVLAYADDVTILVTSIANFPIIEDIHLFERASGARLNPRKTKALAVGSWCTLETALRIDNHPHVSILGVTFWITIEQTMKDRWARLTGKVCTKTKKTYARDPCLAHRLRYVHTFLLFII